MNQTYSILIVDDNKDTVEIIKDDLEDLGHFVFDIIEDLDDALAFITENHNKIDLAIIDENFENTHADSTLSSGLGLGNKLRKSHPLLCSIMLTGREYNVATSRMALKPSYAGFIDFLDKNDVDTSKNFSYDELFMNEEFLKRIERRRKKKEKDIETFFNILNDGTRLKLASIASQGSKPEFYSRLENCIDNYKDVFSGRFLRSELNDPAQLRPYILLLLEKTANSPILLGEFNETSGTIPKKELSVYLNQESTNKELDYRTFLKCYTIFSSGKSLPINLKLDGFGENYKRYANSPNGLKYLKNRLIARRVLVALQSEVTLFFFDKSYNFADTSRSLKYGKNIEKSKRTFNSQFYNTTLGLKHGDGTICIDKEYLFYGEIVFIDYILPYMKKFHDLCLEYNNICEKNADADMPSGISYNFEEFSHYDFLPHIRNNIYNRNEESITKFKEILTPDYKSLIPLFDYFFSKDDETLASKLLLT